MRLRHLVEDLHAVALGRRVLQGDLDALAHVLDVDEGARLPAGAVDGERVAHGGLHEETVEHGAVVAVVVEAVDEALVALRLRGVGAPDDALVEVSDAQLVVLGVEGEDVLIQHLGHVVDRPRVGGVEDLLFHGGAVLGVHLDVQVALWDLHPGGAVAVDAHGAQVYDVHVQPGFHDGHEQVVRRVDVVIYRVSLRPRRLHGVRRGALLGVVNHCVRLELLDKGEQPLVVLRDVEMAEADRVPGDFVPRLQALLNGSDRGQGGHAQFLVDGAA